VTEQREQIADAAEALRVTGQRAASGEQRSQGREQRSKSREQTPDRREQKAEILLSMLHVVVTLRLSRQQTTG
jgi:hypothetical protein